MLRDILISAFEQKGLNAERLAKLTGISETHINAILDTDQKRLPSAPYVRGYLIKMAQALELDSQKLWEIHKGELGAKSSGKEDTLPANRFVIQRIPKKYFILGAVSLVLIGYFAVNINRLFGRPTLEILNPQEEIMHTANATYIISGKTSPENSLSINNEEVFVDASGNFEKEYSLQPGSNAFEIIAKRFLGRELKVVKQIIYEMKQEPGSKKQ